MEPQDYEAWLRSKGVPEGGDAFEVCMIHDTYEPWLTGPEASYRACGECLHVYQTAAELLHEHNKAVEQFEATAVENPDDIAICPLCTHDF